MQRQRTMCFDEPIDRHLILVALLALVFSFLVMASLAGPAYAVDSQNATTGIGEAAMGGEPAKQIQDSMVLDKDACDQTPDDEVEDEAVLPGGIASENSVTRQASDSAAKSANMEGMARQDGQKPELQVEGKSNQSDVVVAEQQVEPKASQEPGNEGVQEAESKTQHAQANALQSPKKTTSSNGNAQLGVKNAMSQPAKQAAGNAKTKPVAKPAVAHNTGKGDLEPGKYFIVSALSSRQVLDVSGASKANRGNVIAWHGTGNANQQWSITLDKDGYAMIKSVNSGKVLDVEGAKGKKGANVIQYKANGGKNQKWIIKKKGDVYLIASALNSNLVVDLTGNRAVDGTNVEVWKRNDGKNQQFRFVPVTPVKAAPGTQVVADGVYTLKAVSANKTAIDVEAGSKANGANALTWKTTGVAWQAWYLAYDKAGYYTITNINSGKQLVPSSPYALNGINVGQYSAGSGDRAKWKIASAGNGQYTLANKATGTFLAVGSAGKNNSANVQMSRSRQQFVFTAKPAVSSGAAIIEVAANTKLALDVYNNSIAKKAKLGTYASNGGLNQRFLIASFKEGYVIRPFNSRMYLTASESGVLVQEPARKNMQNQIWTIKESRGFATIVNVTTGKAISIPGNASKAVSSVKATVKANSLVAQKFYIHNVAPVPTGTYTIGLSSKQDMVLDVVGASRKNNANVDLWKKNGGNNQKFAITALGGGVYKISNMVTGRVLDVSKGSTKPGANIIMYKWKGSDNQKWRIEFNADFSLKITSIQTGYSLDTVKSSSKSGANVVVSKVNDKSATQKFWVRDASRSLEVVKIGVPCYMQNPELPTGCESVALTNALRYWGYNLGKTTIADSYMPYGDGGVYDFIGSPYNDSGWIICAPGITNTANEYLREVKSDIIARNVTGTSLSGLRTYLDKGQPVVVWTTIGMGEPGGVQWYSSGYPLRNNNHAVVLTGYDPFDGSYQVADSLAGVVWRSGSRFEDLYDAMGKQAVVLEG